MKIREEDLPLTD